MQTANGIEFFQAATPDGLESAINKFLQEHFQEMTISKRSLFFCENYYKASLLYTKKETLLTPEQVKIFGYDNRFTENIIEAENLIKEFVSKQECVFDVISCAHLVPRTSSVVLGGPSYQRISRYELVAVFYQKKSFT